MVDQAPKLQAPAAAMAAAAASIAAIKLLASTSYPRPIVLHTLTLDTYLGRPPLITSGFTFPWLSEGREVRAGEQMCVLAVHASWRVCLRAHLSSQTRAHTPTHALVHAQGQTPPYIIYI